MPWVLNMPKFRIRQSSEYARVLTMRMLHSILNMPEYALTELTECIQDSDYDRVVNMQEFHSVLNTVCHNMTKYGRWRSKDLRRSTLENNYSF